MDEYKVKVFKYDDPREICYVEYTDHSECIHCLTEEIRSLRKEIQRLNGASILRGE